MPGMDGFETARRLRQLPGHGTLPIIALTAYATHEARERIVAAGMDGHLTKPIDFAALGETIDRHLAARKRQAAPTGQASAPADDSGEIAACLQGLITALKTNRPRPCSEALQRLKEMGWQAGRQETENIEQLVALYDFEPALDIAMSMLARLTARGERQ